MPSSTEIFLRYMGYKSAVNAYNRGTVRTALPLVTMNYPDWVKYVGHIHGDAR
jgi:hypothetical protein